MRQPNLRPPPPPLSPSRKTSRRRRRRAVLDHTKKERAWGKKESETRRKMEAKSLSLFLITPNESEFFSPCVKTRSKRACISLFLDSLRLPFFLSSTYAFTLLQKRHFLAKRIRICVNWWFIEAGIIGTKNSAKYGLCVRKI